jgi:hypothetical protein
MTMCSTMAVSVAGMFTSSMRVITLAKRAPERELRFTHGVQNAPSLDQWILLPVVVSAHWTLRP